MYGEDRYAHAPAPYLSGEGEWAKDKMMRGQQMGQRLRENGNEFKPVVRSQRVNKAE